MRKKLMVPIKGTPIGEIANLFGVKKETLKSWEKRGIVNPKKDIAGWRLYEKEDIRKLEKHTGIDVSNLKKSKKMFVIESVALKKGMDMKSIQKNKNKEQSSVDVFLKKIGNAVKRSRKAKRLKLIDVTKQMKISTATLSHIEHGKRKSLRFGVLLRLAELYGVSFLDLIGERVLSMGEANKQEIEYEEKIEFLEKEIKSITKHTQKIEIELDETQHRIESACEPESDKCLMCFMRDNCRNIKNRRDE